MILNISSLTENPTIRVLKKYSRFDKIAKEKGFLKNPVVTENDKFEVYDITSGGIMASLSPMILGPVIDEFGDVIGYNIEDAWQGLKVWSMHMNGGKFSLNSKPLWVDGDEKINPLDVKAWFPEWHKWSAYIRFSGEAKRHRVKVVKGENNPNIPLFSYYRGKKFKYEDARKVMYIRWYAKLVKKTKAFKYLKERFEKGTSLIFLDSDGQPRDEKIKPLNYSNMKKRIDDPNKIFGHGFVLGCVILGIDVWSDEYLE